MSRRTNAATTADRRQAEILRAGDACERCGWLAWSRSRQEQLSLRPRTDADRIRPREASTSPAFWVLCPTCTVKHDGSGRRPGRRNKTAKKTAKPSLRRHEVAVAAGRRSVR